MTLNRLLTKTIDLRLAFYLISAFIVFTAIGTLSHEFGHYAAAKLLGHNASISYGFTYYSTHISARDSFIITLCGPLQTVMTGTAGFLLLLYYKNRFYASDRLNFRQWLLVFVSLFWLREVFNVVHGVGIYVLKGYFPTGSDEIYLAQDSGIPLLSISLPAAIAGSLILACVVFKFIPAAQRLTFLISGLIGGVLGFYTWMFWLGPLIMP